MKTFKTLILILICVMLVSCDNHKPNKSTTDLSLPPVVQIRAPHFKTAHITGSSIYFEANYFSLEENSTDWAATWKSDKDGIIFQEDLLETNQSSFSTTQLSDSTHIITVSFTNPDLDEPVENHVVVENTLPEELDYSQYVYLGTFHNSQYFFTNFCETWPAADALCLSNNGHLVTITTESELTFLRSGLRNNWATNRDSAEVNTTWLGLQYNEQSEDHEWVTGEEFEYYITGNDPEYEEFPYHPDPVRPFVYLSRFDDFWEYSQNSVPRRFVLEIELAEDE